MLPSQRATSRVCAVLTLDGVRYQVCDADWRKVMDTIQQMRAKAQPQRAQPQQPPQQKRPFLPR